jgi:hypothetical protein
MNANPPPDPTREKLAALVRAVTLAGAEVAFAGLFAYIIYLTWDASAQQPPSISGPIQGAAAALAVALAAGYAAALGMQPASGSTAFAWIREGGLKTSDFWLFLGVLLYMAVGAACGLTYLANVDETPSLLKTVSIAFGGYVIAYLGTAYKQLSQ